MATFSCEVFKHQRRRDGSYPVKLRVTHNRTVRRLATNLTAYPEDLTRSLKIKGGQLKTRCDALMKDCREAVAQISVFDLPKMTADQLCDAIRRTLERQDWSLDFFVFAHDEFQPTKSPATRRHYDTAIHAFARFLGRESIDINEITGRMLQSFAEFLDKEPKYMKTPLGYKVTEKAKSGVSTVNYIRALASIFNAARRKYNDEDGGDVRIPRTPFENVDLSGRPCKGQNSLGVKGIQALIDYKPDTEARQRARDLFLVSFALMGANVADMYLADPPVGGVWKYNRAKTTKKAGKGARMEVTIPKEIEPELRRLSAGAAPGRWLCLSSRWKDKDYISSSVRDGLKPFARTLGLEPFTIYAARHSWATIARTKAGVDKATVDECLAHSGRMKMADVYIEKDFEILNAANAKVLALFSWDSRLK